MLSATSLLVLSLVLQSTPAQTPRPAGTTTTPRATTLEIRVTDRVGAAVAGAKVTVEGPVSREGTADRDGVVTLKNVSAGTYRLRFSRDGFFTFEKEVVVKAGATMAVDAALSPAPPPPKPEPTPAPPPPPPAPAPSQPTLMPGDPKTLSIPDFANAQVIGREAVKETAIGCSGASLSRVIQARDAIPARTNADADEMLYVIAGDAAIKIAGKEQAIAPGWFSIVPRGAEYSVTRKGRNPVVFLSVVNGHPCAVAGSKN